jgi:predicted nuclease of restriction endonuclease-like RecB superfamily
LLDNDDLGWVGEVVDVVASVAGQPWRVALERLDDTRRVEQPRAPVRFAAVVGAIQRVLGGRGRNAARARTARSLVLGKPVLTEAEREARIASAARELEVTSAAIETMLWSDLPRERPVELPQGRPSELEVAAVANVHLLQRAMMRAQTVTLRAWGDAGALIHATAARGLLTTLSRGPRDEAVLDIVGPLALFHRTGVYGRALASLVPLLAACDRFELELIARGREQTYSVEVASPVLLPPVPARMTLPRQDLVRLCNELARAMRDAVVTPRPPPISAGTSIVCPDLAIEYGGRTTLVELVGFWTIDYLEKKLQLYRDAGVDDVLFCVDESRGCTKDELSGDLPVVRYSRRATVMAREIAERIAVTRMRNGNACLARI